MKASQLARLLNARRVSNGKWMAICPVHRDKHPSLAISEGRRGIVMRCKSNGCDTRDILAALGLTFNDLFYDSITPQVRARISLHEQRSNLEQKLGLVIWLGALEKPKYWQTAEQRIRRELLALRCRIEPEVVYREWRGQVWDLMNQTQRERVIEEAWNLHTLRNNGH